MHLFIGILIIALLLNATPAWVYFGVLIGFILIVYYGLRDIAFGKLVYDDSDMHFNASNTREKSASVTRLFPSGQHDSSRWARNILSDSGNYLIIDTETTGLTRRDEVVEIGVIDMAGNTVFHSYIKPPKRRKMPPDAERIHKISLTFLKDKPTMTDVIEKLRTVVRGKTLIAYNAEFDERLLRQTCKKYNLKPLGNKWECAMIPYAAWFGEWNDYRNDYKWQKLPSAGHDALSDCLATRKIIIEMSGGRV